MNADNFFRTYFPQLAKVDAPYAWQARCFHDILSGNWPDTLPLPTGTGKTAIMQIWLLALAWSNIEANASKSAIPRRLAWVVNRRVVVDQATEEAGRIARAIDDLPGDDPLRESLEALSGNDRALAVSTLRGQKADNQEWSTDRKSVV